MSVYSEDTEVKHIFTSIKGHNSSPISMPMHSLKKIGQKLLKLEPGNEALTDGRNPKPLLPDINVHAKFEENWSKTTQVRAWKRSADGRTETQNDSEGTA